MSVLVRLISRFWEEDVMVRQIMLDKVYLLPVIGLDIALLIMVWKREEIASAVNCMLTLDNALQSNNYKHAPRKRFNRGIL